MLYYCTSLFHDSISPLDSNACKCFRNKTHLNCRSGCISQRAPCMIWAFEEHRSGWYISPLIAFRVHTNTNVVTLTVHQILFLRALHFPKSPSPLSLTTNTWPREFQRTIWPYLATISASTLGWNRFYRVDFSVFRWIKINCIIR